MPQATAIGFTTPLFCMLHIASSVHCDATYKTAKGHFELYGIIGTFEGAGFPLAYLMLDTTKAPSADDEDQPFTLTEALTGFFCSIRDQGLHPQYFYTDKDFAQMNAAKEVWPEAGIQLCQWHVERAVKRKLASRKRIKCSKYQVDEAVTEFDFIDPTFIPEEHLEAEFVVCPPTLRETVINLMRKHFNMHPKIPVGASGEFWTCAEIHRSAVCEMYDFCVAHGLTPLWAYLWSSWYKATRWTLWARSTHPNIPLAKTNMVIEAH